MRRVQILATILGLATSTACAEDENPVVKRWLSLYQDRAAALSVSSADDDQVAIELRPQPLLTYTNPVRSIDGHGSVFLWTQSGRPMLIGAFWSVITPGTTDMRHLSREWHSMTGENIAVELDAQTIWSSTEPGIAWQTIPKTDPPSRSRPLRLVQMRQIAGRISAEIHTQESELRLMPQPVYRYPAKSGVLDGAIFAWVMGTDPELLAVVEAREVDGGPNEWALGFVHFTNAPVTAALDDVEVFAAERWSATASAGRHHLGIAVERHPAELPE